MRRILRGLKWIVATLVSAAIVLFVPQIAVGFMIIPTVDLVENPYGKVLLGFAASGVFIWLIMNFAEIAMIWVTVQVEKFMRYLSKRFKTRLAEELVKAQ